MESYQQSKKETFIAGGNSYVVQRGRWCDMNILNVHIPTEVKIDNTRITEPTPCIQ
jgi:hypothetical protein